MIAGILERGIVREAGFGPGTGTTLLVAQGSDRLFYRLCGKERTSVLMVSPPGDPDFPRYVEIGRYLHRLGLGAPEIRETDPATCTLIMEDLGDETLYAFARRETDARLFAARYRDVVTLLARLQVETKDSLAECPAAAQRAFDYERLRWETDYFRENFLEGECGLPAERTAALAGDFHRLAECVEREQATAFMHRDFQSMNILLKDDAIRLVDFQGARRGSFAYDLASLLKDAYIELPRPLRAELLEAYRKELSTRSGVKIAAKEIEQAFLIAGLQRNMQALGAFGFLSRVKNKPAFRRFIPLCLRHLNEGLAELETSGGPLGRLAALTEACSGLRV